MVRYGARLAPEWLHPTPPLHSEAQKILEREREKKKEEARRHIFRAENGNAILESYYPCRGSEVRSTIGIPDFVIRGGGEQKRSEIWGSKGLVSRFMDQPENSRLRTEGGSLQ